MKKFTVSGTGCALADFVYNGVDFSGSEFTKYLSKEDGDGGLHPGRLVFTEELEKYSAKKYAKVVSDITKGKNPDVFNVGGPSIVSLVNTAQLLINEDIDVKFYGAAGEDVIGKKIMTQLEKTPLNIDNYKMIGSRITPYTDVLSDPNYDNGQGERTFINNIGAAWDYTPGQLNNGFFDSAMVCFGGTALVPQIHDALTDLLKTAKEKNCFTLVNTVFDFRNEKKNPGKPWPLGASDESYKLIDVLVADMEEALKLSGTNSIEEAHDYFIEKGLSAYIVTHGAEAIHLFSDGSKFPAVKKSLPVSQRVGEELKSGAAPKGDTTGCGDNFTGGIIASIAWQLKNDTDNLNLELATTWGVASGGFTCFYIGGTYTEKNTGEKLQHIESYQKDYLKQIEE